MAGKTFWEEGYEDPSVSAAARPQGAVADAATGVTENGAGGDGAGGNVIADTVTGVSPGYYAPTYQQVPLYPQQTRYEIPDFTGSQEMIDFIRQQRRQYTPLTDEERKRLKKRSALTKMIKSIGNVANGIVRLNGANRNVAMPVSGQSEPVSGGYYERLLAEREADNEKIQQWNAALAKAEAAQMGQLRKDHEQKLKDLDAACKQELAMAKLEMLSANADKAKTDAEIKAIQKKYAEVKAQEEIKYKQKQQEYLDARKREAEHMAERPFGRSGGGGGGGKNPPSITVKGKTYTANSKEEYESLVYELAKANGVPYEKMGKPRKVSVVAGELRSLK